MENNEHTQLDLKQRVEIGYENSISNAFIMDVLVKTASVDEGKDLFVKLKEVFESHAALFKDLMAENIRREANDGHREV